MSLSIRKLSASHSAMNVLITFIEVKNINILEPISKSFKYKKIESLSNNYNNYNKIHCSIAEIPPPYCFVCNKYMTTSQCKNMNRLKSCPLF